MKAYRLFGFIIITGVLLTACSSSLVEPESTPNQLLVTAPGEPVIREAEMAPTEIIPPGEIILEEVEESPGSQAQVQWPDGEVQLDDQGFVEVAVTPLNLNAPDGTLNFSVGLNTHSVDLGMDLASLATLEADNGLGVQAVLWDAPRGGHHVSGVLSFPTTTAGAKLLEGAYNLTLTIHDLDAPERSFSWSQSN